MRRIALAVTGTVSALVALFSYHTSTSSQLAGAGTATAAGSGAAASDGSSGSSVSGSSGSSGTSGASGSASSDSSSGGSFTGDAVDTRWGVVQVRITVADGKITASEAVRYPTENPRDQEINAYAVPQLNSEAVQQQSGDIDAVSGATVTSDGYIQSLQSAIDQANL
jgi:uncharacterized protein with FMN-binding domain